MTVETEKDQTIHELNADANAATSSTPADGAVLEKGESTPSDEKSATAVENDYPVTYTAEEEKRVLRKIDLRLLPIMMISRSWYSLVANFADHVPRVHFFSPAWGLAYADKVGSIILCLLLCACLIMPHSLGTAWQSCYASFL